MGEPKNGFGPRNEPLQWKGERRERPATQRQPLLPREGRVLPRRQTPSGRWRRLCAVVKRVCSGFRTERTSSWRRGFAREQSFSIEHVGGEHIGDHFNRRANCRLRPRLVAGLQWVTFGLVNTLIVCGQTHAYIFPHGRRGFRAKSLSHRNFRLRLMSGVQLLCRSKSRRDVTS